jgi:hypothetical protein
MAKKRNLKALYGQWVHSREEDTNDEIVFRPSSYAFPPSRGRAAFELGSDHSYLSAGVGSNDISEVREGRWELENGVDLKIRVELKNERDVFTVTSVENDRLTIRKKKSQ